MRTCIPSPGPMWATWLKFVGLEIIFDLSSGSLSISLKKAEWFLLSAFPIFARHVEPVTKKELNPHRLCCIRSSSGTLNTNLLLLLVRSICFLLLSDVSGTLRTAPTVTSQCKFVCLRVMLTQNYPTQVPSHAKVTSLKIIQAAWYHFPISPLAQYSPANLFLKYISLGGSQLRRFSVPSMFNGLICFQEGGRNQLKLSIHWEGTPPLELTQLSSIFKEKYLPFAGQ